MGDAGRKKQWPKPYCKLATPNPPETLRSQPARSRANALPHSRPPKRRARSVFAKTHRAQTPNFPKRPRRDAIDPSTLDVVFDLPRLHVWLLPAAYGGRTRSAKTPPAEHKRPRVRIPEVARSCVRATSDKPHLFEGPGGPRSPPLQTWSNSAVAASPPSLHKRCGNMKCRSFSLFSAPSSKTPFKDIAALEHHTRVHGCARMPLLVCVD